MYRRNILWMLILVLFGTTWIQAKEVNLLSSRQEFLLRPFLDQFEKESGITVNVAYLQKGLLERLQRRPGEVDAVLTVDIANLTSIKNADLLQPIQSQVIEANIPAQFRDPEDHWFGLSGRARVLYYSKDRIKVSELSTYEALADERFKGRICTRSGYHDYNIALLSAMIAHHGKDKAQEWLLGLKNNLARKPQGNDRGQVQAIYEGQCDLSIGNTYYMGKMLENEKQQAWANSVHLFFPNQQDRGTHMNISGGGVTKAARNKNEAIQLLEFLSGQEAQYMYAQVNHEYPLKSGVEYSKIVSGFGQEQPEVKNGHFKPDSINLAKIGEFRQEALKMVDEVAFDQAASN